MNIPSNEVKRKYHYWNVFFQQPNRRIATNVSICFVQLNPDFFQKLLRPIQTFSYQLFDVPCKSLSSISISDHYVDHEPMAAVF